MFKEIINLSTKNTNKNFESLSRKRNKSTPNIFSKKEETKTSGYYQKIYSLNHFKEDLNSSSKTKKMIPKKISLKNVFKQPNYPKPEFQCRKITDAKWPFSLKKSESKESIKERIKLSRPSKLFHNFINIQWLRRKFPESVINKSIYTLLPNNGKPVIPDDESEEDKRHRLMIEYLESLKGPMGRDQYIDINPKYFFNKQTWETVLKLKQIFLDFDEDGNRRMELDEMQEMFNSNKINASINDLVELFFKGKKFKESEIMKLYLNFHQFINFALTKDQEFREFMRNIKEKAEKEKEDKVKKTKTFSNGSKSSEIDEEAEEDELDEEKGQYLPMNFKSLLDYFVDRGKQRESKDIINKAIKEMNEIINTNIKKRKGARKPTNMKQRRSSVNSETLFNNQKPLKMNEDETNLSNSNNTNNTNKIPISRRKTLLTQKTIIPNKLKSILRELKNVNKSSNKLFDDDFDKMELDLEEDDVKIDYEKQLKEVDFNKLINEFSNLFSVSQIPKKKIKKQVSIVSKVKIENKKEIEKKEEKKENQGDKNINDNEKINKKILKKSASLSLINTLSTKTKDNTINNKISTGKIAKANTFYYNKVNNNKNLSMNDFKSIDKNIKIPRSNPYFERKVKNYNNKYYKKIKFINNNRSSLNKTNLPKFLEELKDNNKNIYKINDYMFKSKEKLPILKSNSLKSKSNSVNYSSSHLQKRNKFIFPSTKAEFNTLQRTKIDLNFKGGKINLFKKDINLKLPRSNSKLDYVPLGLLYNSKIKLLEHENNM